MDFYDFMEECKAMNLPADEAIKAWKEACAEEQARFEEDYENDPFVIDGERQADLISLYRREK